jgi:hypothetical protein
MTLKKGIKRLFERTIPTRRSRSHEKAKFIPSWLTRGSCGVLLGRVLGGFLVYLRVSSKFFLGSCPFGVGFIKLVETNNLISK